MTKAMIVAPHPDDAELAMGASLAKMVASGWDVFVLDLTDGEPTPHGSHEIRAQETSAATEILQIARRSCLGLPNRYLEASLENRRRLAEQIRVYEPDMLFGPLLPDDHPDHVATAELVAAARFEAKYHKTSMAGPPHWVRRAYGYYSVHKHHYDEPSFIVDVTDFWERKVAALQAYGSQIRTGAAGDAASLLDKVEAVGRYFGQCIGRTHAEPFVAYEPISIVRLDLLAELC
jgi:bacillithiol biosynthesis deacetylase BshB1